MDAAQQQSPSLINDANYLQDKQSAFACAEKEPLTLFQVQWNDVLLSAPAFCRFPPPLSI
jgi:hypothetical protein